MPGCVAVVRHAALRLGDADGIGIVARTPGALDRIATALAPQWQLDGPAFAQADLDRALDIDTRVASGGPRQHALRRDGLDTASPWSVDLAWASRQQLRRAASRCRWKRWPDFPVWGNPPRGGIRGANPTPGAADGGGQAAAGSGQRGCA